jgi:hypothetical protein
MRASRDPQAVGSHTSMRRQILTNRTLSAHANEDICRTPNSRKIPDYFDLSTIKNKVQLSTMTKERSGISEAQAQSDVQAWMRGKQF